MLLRPGAIPAGAGWAFEVKWDGFRAVVSTEDGLRVRSRRSWDMTGRVPELASLPAGLVLDGELVAFNYRGAPCWPRLCRRVLHGDGSIPVTFVAFDVLRVEGHDVTCNPWSVRRALLEDLWEPAPCARLSDVFDDGHVLYQAVCEHGLEGIVAKRTSGTYRPGQRGWVKIKNPSYWRRDHELASLWRSHEPRSHGELQAASAAGLR